MSNEAPPQSRPQMAGSPSVTTALKHAPLGIAIFDNQMRYLAASRQYLTDQRLPPDVPRIVLHGQVCRRELAVEIDGVHA